jgi:hypothetical protein
MTLRGIARNVVRALCICTLAVLTAGCPLRIQGEITTKPAGVGPGGSGPGTIMAGTWCCKTATTKKGTGCTAVPKGTTATSCPSAGGDQAYCSTVRATQLTMLELSPVIESHTGRVVRPDRLLKNGPAVLVQAIDPQTFYTANDAKQLAALFAGVEKLLKD